MELNNEKETGFLSILKSIQPTNNPFKLSISKNFVDFLIYECKPFYIIRKFPFMSISHKIHFNEGFDKSIVIEDFDNVKFINIEFNENKINVISYHKSKIASEIFTIL